MKAIRFRAFVSEVERMNWIVQDLLPDMGWTLLVGQQGLGKTTLTLQLCAAIQDGLPFFGRQTNQRNVLFIQADSGTAEWRQMVKRIAPTSEGFTVVDVEPKCLNNTIYVERLKYLIEQTKPGFIVFDSLYNLTSSPINSELILNPINTMKVLSGHTPFLVIHHPPHGEMRAAGHHSLAANCSNEWYLLKTKLKINKGRLVSVKEILLERDDAGLWRLKNDDDDLLERYPELRSRA